MIGDRQEAYRKKFMAKMYVAWSRAMNYSHYLSLDENHHAMDDSLGFMWWLLLIAFGGGDHHYLLPLEKAQS